VSLCVVDLQEVDELTQQTDARWALRQHEQEYKDANGRVGALTGVLRAHDRHDFI
jgi:hypothetical protein